jgi:hypothetical protein
LDDAAKIADREPSYWWHFKLGMGESFFLFVMFIGSVIHAFIPQLMDFKLLEARINRLKHLKRQLPNDEQLKRIEFIDRME